MVGWNLTRKLAKLSRLSWGDRLVVLQTLVLLPAIALALSTIGLPATQRHLIRLSPGATAELSVARSSQAYWFANLVNRVARHYPIWGNCLKRSLTLWFLLRRHGIISDLRIGVRRHQGEFQAHAWVEYDGQIINDQPTVYEHYGVFEKNFGAPL